LTGEAAGAAVALNRGAGGRTRAMQTTIGSRGDGRALIGADAVAGFADAILIAGRSALGFARVGGPARALARERREAPHAQAQGRAGRSVSARRGREAAPPLTK